MPLSVEMDLGGLERFTMSSLDNNSIERGAILVSGIGSETKEK